MSRAASTMVPCKQKKGPTFVGPFDEAVARMLGLSVREMLDDLVLRRVLGFLDRDGEDRGDDAEDGSDVVRGGEAAPEGLREAGDVVADAATDAPGGEDDAVVDATVLQAEEVVGRWPGTGSGSAPYMAPMQAPTTSSMAIERVRAGAAQPTSTACARKTMIIVRTRPIASETIPAIGRPTPLPMASATVNQNALPSARPKTLSRERRILRRRCRVAPKQSVATFDDDADHHQAGERGEGVHEPEAGRTAGS